MAQPYRKRRGQVKMAAFPSTLENSPLVGWPMVCEAAALIGLGALGGKRVSVLPEAVGRRCSAVGRLGSLPAAALPGVGQVNLAWPGLEGFGA